MAPALWDERRENCLKKRGQNDTAVTRDTKGAWTIATALKTRASASSNGGWSDRGHSSQGAPDGVESLAAAVFLTGYPNARAGIGAELTDCLNAGAGNGRAVGSGRVAAVVFAPGFTSCWNARAADFPEHAADGSATVVEGSDSGDYPTEGAGNGGELIAGRCGTIDSVRVVTHCPLFGAGVGAGVTVIGAGIGNCLPALAHSGRAKRICLQGHACIYCVMEMFACVNGAAELQPEIICMHTLSSCAWRASHLAQTASEPARWAFICRSIPSIGRQTCSSRARKTWPRARMPIICTRIRVSTARKR